MYEFIYTKHCNGAYVYVSADCRVDDGECAHTHAQRRGVIVIVKVIWVHNALFLIENTRLSKTHNVVWKKNANKRAYGRGYWTFVYYLSSSSFYFLLICHEPTNFPQSQHPADKNVPHLSRADSAQNVIYKIEQLLCWLIETSPVLITNSRYG